MGEWQTVRLDSIGSKISIGPFGSRMKSDCYVPTGVPVIRGTNLTGGRSFSGNWVYVTEQTADELGNCCVSAGDLVFPHRGSIGEVGIVTDEFPRYVMSSSLMKLTCDLSKVEPSYVYYFFKSERGRHELLKNASQVGTPGIGQPLNSLKGIEIPIPPLPEQRAIAHILGTLDDKIELNRRMNETLEAMARALFKSWFVDFEPVRAKAEGRDTGLPKEIADLFPDSFEDSELGEVPKGWRVGSFSDASEVFDSKRVPLSGREREQRKGHYPYYGAASVMDYVDDYLFDGIYLLLGEDGSVINSNGTPVTQYAWGKFWVNNHAHVIQGKNGFCTEHLLLHLDNTNITAFVTGAVQPKLNQGNLNRIPIIVPEPEILAAFNTAVSPFFAKIRNFTEQSRTLAAQRDALLPKLLSGEVRVENLCT